MAQVAAPKEIVPGWHLLDKQQDGYNGISLNKAYGLLKDKPAKKVIVAVLDGGIDTLHEDLKAILWHNAKEIPGNGKDDDGNGFTDDVYGWNFLGNASGQNVFKVNQEVVRVYHELKPEFEGRRPDTTTMNAAEKKRWHLWVAANNYLEVKPEVKFGLRLLQASYKATG